MMKRLRIELAEVAAYPNLCLAAWKAARGKRGRADVAAFLGDLDGRLERLGRDIVRAAVPYGGGREFFIHDPKRRLIHAACFEDRVLHHAIMNLAEPVFERALIPASFACRPGKGVHAAVREVQRDLRRFPWFVKVDIAGYFPAIDHRLLFALLCRRFKGEGFLALLWRIIDAYHPQAGKGLPIGALTSQHFANHYLDGVDRWLLAQADVGTAVRYMDDIVWWCPNQAAARRTLAGLGVYLHAERALRLKPESQINRSARGLSYCGFRVSPGAVRLTARKQRRVRELRERWEQAWEAGLIGERELQRAYDAVHAITLHADSRGWRRKHLQIHPSQYDDADGCRS